MYNNNVNWDPSAKTLAVFSHPNHELSIFGLLKRVKATFIFLTDGGGKHRINETRAGLESIGLLDRAFFLDHTEESFYEALLQMDHEFFAKVAVEVRDTICFLKSEQILCDAIEFYNPVHDMTLPILSSSLGLSWDSVFEVPLIYQKSGPKEEYGVQTVPDSKSDKIEFVLTEEESTSKKNALEKTYTILRDTLGPILLASPTALKKETIFPASSPLRGPTEGYSLRYNRRAAELQSAGKISDKITHELHFTTVVSNLMGIASE